MTEYAALEPHGSLEQLFDDVWVVRGSVVMKPLVRLPRNMVVLRDGDALTLIHSIRLSDAGMRELGALGMIANVVRIGGHAMDDAWYVGEHGATLWTLPGAKHPSGLPVQRELTATDLPHPDLSLFMFEHTIAPESAVVHGRHRLLITCDSVQNWVDTTGCSAPAKVAARVMGFLERPVQIGPPWRKGMTPAGGSLKPDFERLAGLAFDHVIGAHGVIRRDDARERLRETIAATFG